MTEGKAISIGEAFAEQGVEISVHAPYFINFANPDDEMAAKSYGYVLDTAKVLKLMGGKRVVFHPAAQGKVSREEAVAKTEERLKILRDYILDNPKLFNINSALVAEGRDFAYYMKKFSDEYAARTKEQFRLECKDFNAAETPVLDETALKKAESFSRVFSCRKNLQSGKEPRFKSLRLKKPKSRRR